MENDQLADRQIYQPAHRIEFDNVNSTFYEVNNPKFKPLLYIQNSPTLTK